MKSEVHVYRDENGHYDLEVNKSPSWGQRQVRAEGLIPDDVLV